MVFMGHGRSPQLDEFAALDIQTGRDLRNLRGMGPALQAIALTADDGEEGDEMEEDEHEDDEDEDDDDGEEEENEDEGKGNDNADEAGAEAGPGHDGE